MHGHIFVAHMGILKKEGGRYRVGDQRGKVEKLPGKLYSLIEKSFQFNSAKLNLKVMQCPTL